MTDLPDAAAPEWLPVLRHVVRSSGHEMRNALNGLVVNLEVVRSLTSGPEGGSRSTATFVDQAVQQSEESVRMAESTIALLNLVVSAIGPDGVVRCELAGPHAIRITAAESDVERAARELNEVPGKTILSVETDGPGIILTVSEDGSAQTT